VPNIFQLDVELEPKKDVVSKLRSNDKGKWSKIKEKIKIFLN
jgi:hypothetical protein